MRFRLRGIRSWLICLAGIAVLPGGALLVGAASTLRDRQIADVNEDLDRTARLVAERLRARFELIHGTLMTFAGLAAVRDHDGEGCSAVARDIVERGQGYGNIAAATSDGAVFCSSARAPPRFTVADRLYFRRAMQSTDAVVGEYAVGRAVQRPLIHIAHPVFGAEGERRGVVFAAIDLAHVAGLLQDVGPSTDAIVTVVDGRGTILSRQPDPENWVRSEPEASVVQRMTAHREGLAEAAGVDGELRLYAFAPVHLGRAATDLVVSVSVPRATALAAVNRVFSRTLLWYVFVGIASVTAAWALGEFGLVRRIRRLASAARRLTRGDLGTRSGLGGLRDEIGELGAAFDEMAAAIEGLTRQNRLILESAGVGIFGINREGVITFMNPAGAKMLGWPSSQLGSAGAIPRSIGDIVAPGDGARDVLAVLSDGSTPQAEDRMFRREDGTTFPVNALATSLRDGDQIVGAVVTFRDVSDHRRLEQQVQHLQKMEAMGRLASGVAHDFSNLLSVIVSAGQSLQQGLGPGNVLRADADDVVAAGTRGTALTRQLLAFSRSQVLQPTVLDPNQVLEGLTKLLVRLLGDDIEATFSLRSCGRVRVDLTQLEQVVMNLIVNARDAMPRGGRLTIETADVELDGIHRRGRFGARPGKYAMIAVTDEGTGMDEETLGRIFEPFFTTKEPAKGTGLGLSTVWGIVKQTCGDIHVCSTPGQGSTFRIYLPYVDDRVAAERAAPGSARDDAVASTGPSARLTAPWPSGCAGVSSARKRSS
jgi:two-component system cell cycle sensor histidine kinase/response regulator CckA